MFRRRPVDGRERGWEALHPVDRLLLFRRISLQSGQYWYDSQVTWASVLQVFTKVLRGNFVYIMLDGGMPIRRPKMARV